MFLCSSPHFYVLLFQFSADLVIFTEEILNGKLHFLYSVAFGILKMLSRVCFHDVLQPAVEQFVHDMTVSQFIQ